MTAIIANILINGQPKKVWKIVSEIDNDSQFWKGIKHITNKTKDGNVITREVTLKNADKCYQKIMLFPMEGIHIRWTKGAINGIKDIMIFAMGQQTLLKVEMNYKLRGAARMFSRVVSEEILKEAELAMQLIKEEVEKKESCLISSRTIGSYIPGHH